MTMSMMGTRMSIGTPYMAVAVLRRTNGRATESMGMRMKRLLKQRIRSRRQGRKR